MRSSDGWPDPVTARRSTRVEGFAGGTESFAVIRSSLRYRTPGRRPIVKWTLVRYRAKPEQADENQRLSAAVFEELQRKAPSGLRYAVFRLPDDTFVHLASLEDG